MRVVNSSPGHLLLWLDPNVSQCPSLGSVRCQLQEACDVSGVPRLGGISVVAVRWCPPPFPFPLLYWLCLGGWGACTAILQAGCLCCTFVTESLSHYMWSFVLFHVQLGIGWGRGGSRLVSSSFADGARVLLWALDMPVCLVESEA